MRARTSPIRVVALGASAGGLEPLEQFFRNLSPTSGLTFLVVQHLSPDHKSMMVELLTKQTSIPVVAAEDGVELAPDHIYLLPPRKVMTVRDGKIVLAERDSAELTLPIDILFESMARELGSACAGVVLSGTGSDGRRGVVALKSAGALVLAQDPSQAKFDGMPMAAISTGAVDSIALVEDMPKLLVAPPDAREEDTPLGVLYGLLREQHKIDFSLYKLATLMRRIERRVAVCQAPSLEAYVAHASTSRDEVSALFKELLIGVTHMFRDPDAYSVIEREVITSLCERTRPGEPLRVWVAGCSTGEEVYSLAILFSEYFERSGRARDLKIYATDIDRDALDTASFGRYSANALAVLSEARRDQYFRRSGDEYQVIPEIRQRVVFALHDVTRDPPFGRTALVSCRNVLIYFEPELQKRVLDSLVFALRPGGFLWLGPSETVGNRGDELSVVDARWKVYQRTTVYRHLPSVPAIATAIPRRPVVLDSRLDDAYAELVRAYVPPTVLVDEHHEILHVFGAPGPLLRLAPGAATLNLLELVPPQLISLIGVGSTRALRDLEPVIYQDIATDLGAATLEIRPIVSRAGLGRRLLISFRHESHSPAPRNTTELIASDTAARIAELQHEVSHSRENLQATVEELEATNEELQATNEELLAANEELQATNEELQSVNEELHTVNAEYQHKIDELVEVNDDIANFLRATEIGTLFLDTDLRITRFTEQVNKLIPILDRDLGRPLADLSLRFPCDDLIDILTRVRDTRQPFEREVFTEGDRTVLLRVAPYISQQIVRRGIVVTFVDVTAVKQAERRLAAILDGLPEEIAVLDRDGNVIQVNATWVQFSTENGGSADSRTAVGANYLTVCRAALADDPEVEQVIRGLEDVLAGRRLRFEHEYPCHQPGKQRWFLMVAAPIRGNEVGVVVSHIDVTRRRIAEQGALQ